MEQWKKGTLAWHKATAYAPSPSIQHQWLAYSKLTGLLKGQTGMYKS